MNAPVNFSANTKWSALILVCASAFLASPVAANDQRVGIDYNQDDLPPIVAPLANAETEPSGLIDLNTENMPNAVVPLDLSFDVNIAPTDAPVETETVVYKRDLNFSDFDLVEESPVFLGTYGRTEFDDVEALRDRAGMPSNLNVDPMIPIGAVGIETQF